MSGADSEAEDENAPHVRVAQLLHLPFDEALKECGQLQLYIQEREDAESLEAEFRENWHPEAPAELRQVLEEILDPELAAAAADATEAFLRNPTETHGDMLGEAPSPLDGNGDRTGGGTDESLDDMSVTDHSEIDEDFAGASVVSDVDALLAGSFEEAVQTCDALRQYIQNRGGSEANELEDEFRANWHPDAPSALRQVLMELLDPELASKAVSDHADFLDQMASVLPLESAPRGGAEHEPSPEHPPRSRL
eukprot:TRINITY_DN94268_c0_g1_i1.p1 TRINITY_DN94268_c0_g1~~TRINITY_DN94268_c0_g1_i1.p1  ORF type:complete len:265 (-),score=60.63 TRINITY_DN94268_c0_g1_i1:36-788(-)